MGASTAITANGKHSPGLQELVHSEMLNGVSCRLDRTLIFRGQRLILVEINRSKALLTYADGKTGRLIDLFLAHLDSGSAYSWWFNPVNQEVMQVSKGVRICVRKTDVIGSVRNLGRPFLLGPLDLDDNGFLQALAAWPLNE